MYHYPLNIITGSGLGVSHSSFTQIGDLWTTSGVGQSGIKLFANAATGNLIIQDRVLPLMEMNGAIPLSYVYNSQSKQGQGQWRLGFLKSLKNIPSKINSLASTLTLEEVDGHLTTYTFDSVTNRYWGEALKDGVPYLSYDETTKQWQWFHPAKQTIEIFDSQGLLKQHTDMQGRSTYFNYNQGALSSIQGLSGILYQPVTQNTSTGTQVVWQEKKGSSVTKLHTYEFDQVGNLTKSATADNYTINYLYDLNSHQLMGLSQTDGTQCVIHFNATNNQSPKLESIRFGDNDFIRFQYNQGQTVITDPLQIALYLTYDEKQRLIKKEQERGYNTADSNRDSTFYTYMPQTNNPAYGQLQSITLPGQESEHYQYDANYGHLIEKCGSAGQRTQYVYETGGDRPKLIAEYHYLSNTTDPFVTRYVYDDNYDKLNQRHCFLRFVISPTGRVTEYRPDNHGNRATKREYRNGIVDLTYYKPNEQVTLNAMLGWVTQQDPSTVTLTEYQYDSRGQCTNQYNYSNVDSNGIGNKQDPTTQHTSWNWNDFGLWLSKVDYQTPTILNTTTHKYDQLLRLTYEKDALGQVTSTQYNDVSLSRTVTKPNGQTETKTWNNIGIDIEYKEQATVSSTLQTRTTKFGMDKDWRPIVVYRPDGHKDIQFFDRQQRLGYAVSSLGIVKEYREDRQTRALFTIVYDTPVDINQLYANQPPNDNDLPDVTLLQQQLKPNADKDRCLSQFKDLSDRVAYEVDSENILIQYIYDTLDRTISKVIYKELLTTDEWNNLTQGKSIYRQPNLMQDKCWQWIYNKDGLVIGECDPAGYYTQHDWDNAGIKWHQQIYFQRLAVEERWPQITIIPDQNSAQDVHTNFYTDERGQIILEVDSENYVTQRSFLANGLVSQERRYQQKVSDPNWNRQSWEAPQLPATDSEDQITNNTYDALNRLINQQISNRKQRTISYDKMGEEISHQLFDHTDSTLYDGDHRRGEQTRYDGWEQISAELNPYANLHVMQNPEQAEQLWQTESTRYVYDGTGLKLKAIAPNGGETFYYYDSDRRLIITINALGGILESTLNSFGEPTKTRRYKQSLDETQLNILTGGFVTDQLRSMLQPNDQTDSIETFEYDRRGLKTKYTDAANYITEKYYDSFRRSDEELLPITQQNPTLIITHVYDLRDLELQTTKTDDQKITQIITRTFDDILTKPTQVIDEVGGQTQVNYDRLGRVTKTHQLIEENQFADRNYEYDTLNRLTKEINANQNITTHQYNQQQGTHTVIPPIFGTQEVVTQNIFNETVVHQDALGNLSKKQQDAFGNVAQQIDPLNNTINDTYDVMNFLISHVNQVGVETKYENDLLGHVKKETEDTGNLKLVTQYQSDQWGLVQTKTDATNTITNYQYDNRDCLIQSLRDPDGLQLVVQKTYNAQKQVIDELRGNLAQLDQYKETNLIDNFSRNLGKSVDPNGLTLKKQKTLDAKGQDIAEIISASNDPKTSTTHYFWDLRGKLRYTISAEGRVSENCYDKEGLLLAEINYENKIAVANLTDQTQLADIEVQVTVIQDPNDQITRLFYDANEREQYRITSTGKVTQKFYDQASTALQERLIQTCIYATPWQMEREQLLQITTQDVTVWVQTNQTTKDRHTYLILDSAGHKRFILDGECYVTEQRFDACQRRIMNITYDIKQPNLVNSVNLGDTAFALLVQTSPGQDKVEHWVYDTADRQSYTVNADALVTRYDQDGVDNETCVYQYATSISLIYDTNTLLTTLAQLVTTSQDRAKNKKYDKGNRVTTVIDPEGNAELFTVNALGNVEQHVDCEGNTTTIEFDKAMRPFNEITSPISITVITEQQGTLTDNTLTTTLTRHKEYDRFNNPVSIIEAYGTSAERQLISSYDLDNQLIKTELPGAVIDDPTKPASYQVRPEQKVTLTTERSYNGKEKLVAESNEINSWRFHVLDSDNREVYLVEADGATIGYEYNTFGEVEKEVRYDNRLTIDLTQYTKTGIPLDVIKNNLIISSQDRPTFRVYDNRGDLTDVKKGPKFYYLTEIKGKVYSGTDNMIKKQIFNAFRQCVLQKDLINPQANSWSQQRLWYSFTDRVLARANANGITKVITLTAFGEDSSSIEYAQALQTLPDENTTFSALQSQLVASAGDRQFGTTYDRRGLKLTETQYNAKVQSTQTGSDGHLQMVTINKDLITRRTYNKNGLEVSQTDPDGLTKYKYYNARSDLIAETHFPIEALDPTKQTKTLIPLIYNGIDYFGQIVKTTRFKYGAFSADASAIPAPYQLSPDDHIELKFLDNRNQALYEQDANAYVEGFTYLATPNKKARHWWCLTNINEQSGKTIVHIDEERKIYDARERVIQELILRDNVPQNQFAISRQWNAFGQRIKEGSNDGTFPASWDYDITGACWRTNGVPQSSEDIERQKNNGRGSFTLNCTDLRNFVTVNAQSATKDLSQKAYTDLPDIFTWSISDLERTERVLDPVGNMLGLFSPAYEPSDLDNTSNIPLSMTISSTALLKSKSNQSTISTSTSFTNQLSWTLQQELNVIPKLTIWPATQENVSPDQKQEKSINVQDGRCIVDLSDLPTDRYTYHITYLMTNPFSNTKVPEEIVLYSTQGNVQVDNGVSDQSQNIVIKVTDNNQLLLTGKTANLSAVNLLLNGELVEKIPVATKPSNEEIQINLSTYATGEYILQPIYTDNQIILPSLPFIIYTETLSKTPFAEEVTGTCALQVLDIYGALTWQVPTLWQKQNVTIQIFYIDDQDTSQTQTATIAPSTNLGEYQDKDGNVLICNFIFDYSVKQVTEISLYIESTNGVDSIPLQVAYPPLTTLTAQNNHKQDPDNNNYLSVSSKPLRPRLQYHAPGSQLPEFYVEQEHTGPLSDYAFQALGVSRQTFVDTLRHYNQHPSVLERLKKIICADIKNRYFNPAFEKARCRLNKIYQKNGMHSEQAFSTTYDMLLSNNQAQEANELLRAETDFLKFSKKSFWESYLESEESSLVTDDTIQCYLERFLEHQQLTLELAKCFVQMEKINIVIWQRDANHVLKLKLIEACQQTVDKPFIHLFENADQGQLSGLQSIGLKPDILKKKLRQDKLRQTTTKQEKIDLADDWLDIGKPISDTNTHQLTTVSEPTPVNATTQNYNFSPATIMYLRSQNNPFSNAIEIPDVQLLDTNLDRMATWKQALVSAITSDGLTIDVTGLAAGVYPLKITVNAEEMDYSMTVTGGAWVYRSTAASDASLLKAAIPIHPKYTFAYDAWSNKIEEVTPSPLNYKTTHLYNQDDKELQRSDPETSVIDEQGHATRQIPTVSWGYDERQHKIASVDQRACVEKYEIDAEDKLLRLYNANNEIMEENQRDLFGNSINYFDWTRRQWIRTYDKNNNMLTQTSPGNTVVSYTYNEVNLPNSKKDEANYFHYFGFDALKNVSYRIEPLGQRIDITVDRNGQPLSERYNDGSSRTWSRHPYFDYVVNYWDFSGANYTYSYDYKMQITHETSIGGSHGEMLYQERSTSLVVTAVPTLTTFYTARTKTVPRRDLTYTYKVGRIIEVYDGSQGQRSKMGYDVQNRPVALKLWDVKGSLIRDVTCLYDELDRELINFDTKMRQWTGYDEKGNRRHVYAEVYTDGWNNPLTQDQWFTYSNEGMDFVLIDGGVLNTNIGQIVLTSDQGRSYTYAQGFRQTEKRLNSSSVAITTTLTYDADERFNGSSSSDGQWTSRVYDVRDCMTQYRDNNTTINNAYNANTWLTNSEQIQGSSNTKTTYSNFDAMGNARHQALTYSGGHDDLDQSYIGLDTKCAYDLSGHRVNQYGSGPVNTVGMRYGANGSLTGIKGIWSSVNESDKDAYPQTLVVTSDYTGLSFARRLIPAYVNTAASSTEWTLYFFTANKNYMGSYDFTGVEEQISIPGNWKIAKSALNRQVTSSGGKEVGYDSTHGGSTIVRTRTERASLPYYGTTKKRGLFGIGPSYTNTIQEAMTLADTTPPVSGWQDVNLSPERSGMSGKSGLMGFLLTPILPIKKGRTGLRIENKDNTSFPASSPTTYIATANDTDYSQVASKQYGDSGYANSIQTANGLKPYPGLPVMLPTLLPTRNNSKTFIPQHELMELILADITFYPRLISHQPPKPKKKHSFWNFVIVVVSVAVAIFVPELAVAVAQFLTTLGVSAAVATAVSVGLVAGVTTAALEGLGSVLGVSSFSLRDIATSAISAASMSVFGSYSFLGNVVEDTMLDACIAQITTQLTAIGLGLRPGFDWEELMLATASAGINKGIGTTSALQTESAALNNAIQSGVDTVFTGLVYSGRIDPEILLIQMAGTAVGTAAGNALNNAWTKTPEQAKQIVEEEKQTKPLKTDTPQVRKEAEKKQTIQKRAAQYKAEATEREKDAENSRYNRNEVANKTNSKTQTTTPNNTENNVIKNRTQDWRGAPRKDWQYVKQLDQPIAIDPSFLPDFTGGFTSPFNIIDSFVLGSERYLGVKIGEYVDKSAYYQFSAEGLGQQANVSKHTSLDLKNQSIRMSYGQSALKVVGHGFTVVGVVESGTEVYSTYKKHDGTVSRVASRESGGYLGGFYGAEIGAQAGAEIGVLAGPIGSGIGAFIGALTGGIVGTIFGRDAGTKIYDNIRSENTTNPSQISPRP